MFGSHCVGYMLQLWLVLLFQEVAVVISDQLKGLLTIHVK